MIKRIFILAICNGFLNSAYALNTTEQTEMLATHNKWRQTVGIPAVTWSGSLAKTAQAYADTLKTTQACNPIHSHADGLGENLFWASAMTETSISSTGVQTTTSTAQSITPTDVTDAWGNEVNDYTYSSNTCATGKVCGHYTQLVWKDTTEIGCGNAVCPDNSQVWVCNYTPQGNYIG